MQLQLHTYAGLRHDLGVVPVDGPDVPGPQLHVGLPEGALQGGPVKVCCKLLGVYQPGPGEGGCWFYKIPVFVLCTFTVLLPWRQLCCTSMSQYLYRAERWTNSCKRMQ